MKGENEMKWEQGLYILTFTYNFFMHAINNLKLPAKDLKKAKENPFVLNIKRK